MITFSQKDKRYGHLLIPKSNLTVAKYGCYIASISMLAQKDPTVLLQERFFAQGGYIYSSRAAKAVGMDYKGSTRIAPKKGWCIAVTDHYSPKYPTHFFLVNPEKGLQVDPLKFNPVEEPITYNILQYRIFNNAPVNNPVVSYPDYQIPAIRIALKKGITTDMNTKLGDMTLGHMLAVIQKFIS